MALAPALNAEIVVADSMQVYRGLDVATAKPSAAERARTPHHLLDAVEPGEGFSVAAWLEAANAAIGAIHARGRTALVAGGTGLYIRALLRGLDTAPPTPPAMRAVLADTPLEALVEELARRDPRAAAGIDRKNRRRVERAVAVLRQGGRLARECWTGTREAPPLVVLRRHPADLRDRIARRVDAMFEAGLLEEFRRLTAAGLGPSDTAWQALGYKEVAEWARGRLGRDACRNLLIHRTWSFARRQMTWFRQEPESIWVDVPSGETPGATAERVIRQLPSPEPGRPA